MPDILSTFRQRAESLIHAISDAGGIQATISGLRRQMAEGDRRRAVAKARAQLKRLDAQIQEMITAIGVQAVGLHKSGRLESPELEPLCQHIVQLEASVAQQKTELAKLEAKAPEKAGDGEVVCSSCGKPLLQGGSFCPHCGAAAPAAVTEKRFCVQCGAELRENARFCQRCGSTADVP